MKMKRMTQKSSKLLKLLKPFINPNSHFSTLTLSTEKPSFSYQFKSKSSPLIPQIINLIKSNHKNSWNSIHQLSPTVLNSIFPDKFLEITRSFNNSESAIDFIQHLVSNPDKVDDESVSFALQAVFELAGREPECGKRLLEVYEKVKEWNVNLNVYCVIHLIKCLSYAGLINNAMIIYGDLAPQLKNIRVRNLVIEELLRNCRLDRALHVLDEMLEPNSMVLADKNTMELIFPALLRGKQLGRWVSADEFVRMVARFGRIGFFPCSILITKLISNFCTRKKSNAAWELLHKVMELGGTVDVASCNALLTGLNKAHEFDRMDCLMKEMEEKGIRPNVVTLGISLNHLCKASRLDEALELFQKVRRVEISDDVKPDVKMYNTVIEGLCKVERVEDGLSMMRRMKTESGCSPNTITFNCLIDGFCKVGKLDKARQLFGEIEKEGGQPNIRTMNILVSCLCRDGRVGGALQLYREMLDKGFHGNAVTYTALISGFCGGNNARKAVGLLREMKEKCPPDAIVYYTLIFGLSEFGLMHDVDSVLSEMRSVGFRPDVACYNVMINGFCQKNKLDKVHQLLKDMETDGLKPDNVTYDTLISYFSKTGNLENSPTLVKQMIKDKVVPTFVTDGVLINAFCLRGELDAAMKIFKGIKLSAVTPPNTVIYNILIDCHCRNNLINEALSLFDEMFATDVKPDTNTFNALFKALHEKNMLEKAADLMDKMNEQGCIPDYKTLEVLTQWLSAAGEAENLRHFVEASSSSLER